MPALLRAPALPVCLAEVKCLDNAIKGAGRQARRRFLALDMLGRQPFLKFKGDFGAIVVHGHRPVDEVENHGNRIAVDTGAVFGRKLSCLVLENDAQDVGPQVFRLALDDKLSKEEYLALSDEGRELARSQCLVADYEVSGTRRRLACSADIERVAVSAVKHSPSIRCNKGDIIRIRRQLFKCVGHKADGEPILKMVMVGHRKRLVGVRTGRMTPLMRASRRGKRGSLAKKPLEKHAD